MKQKYEEADSLINAAYKVRDYQRILTLADSLNKTGGLSEGKMYYWMGYSYDHMLKKRMAEFYWKTGMTSVEDSKAPEDLDVYARIASRLTSMKSSIGEYEAALKISLPAIERLQALQCDTTSDYLNLLILTGCCQMVYGMSEEKVNEQLEMAYSQHLERISRDPSSEMFKDAIVGVVNICYNYIFTVSSNHEEAFRWIERYESLVDAYEKSGQARPDYIDKQRARIYLYRASALEENGQHNEAAREYDMLLQTNYGRSAEGHILICDYLKMAGRWEEAADNYAYMDAVMEQYGTGYSIENIQKLQLKKFEFNMKAGRRDTAMAVGMNVMEHLDSAITAMREADAHEQETLRQKEIEMNEKHQQVMRQRQLGRFAIMALLIIALVIYIIIRQRVQRRMKKANNDLTKAHDDLMRAYDQLEETTTAKERMESELRIARDIQMSMVPNDSPDIEGLDMHGSMTPAKEVGGDLYGFVHNGDKLYFCIGDVSGKGVPASLFMAQATRLFRTLASQSMTVADIATRMNAELSENNEQGMFVTMFIAMLDISKHRLDFCNAGHNPPVIDDGKGGLMLLDMEPNAPIGLWPGLEYVGQQINDFFNHPMLLYTDGLNEAENRQQEQYGEERMLEVIAANINADSVGIIEALKADVARFRDGAEPNDDLTMLAIRYATK